MTLCSVTLLTVSAGLTEGVQASPMVSTPLDSVPLFFDGLQSQNAGDSRFVAHTANLRLMFAPDGAVVASVRDAGVRPVWRMRLIDSNPLPTLNGLDLRVGKSHYLSGAVRAAWHTHIPHFSRVKYENVYPGIDLVYYGVHRDLAFDFVIRPGADPSLIRLGFEAVPGMPAPIPLRIADDGSLVVGVGKDEMRLRKPHVYQSFDDTTMTVPGTFALQTLLAPDGNDDVATVIFQLGAYDRSQPLVIDPVLTYSTRLGGLTGLTRGHDIAVDRDGMIYVVGETFGDVFPTNKSVESSSGGSVDVFVVKVDPGTDEIIYSTRLGGSGIDKGLSIVLDDKGQAYVTGSTGSHDFPVVEDACQATFGGGSGAIGDAFVLLLSADGSELVYSSYLGGKGDDIGAGITTDENGVIFVTGETRSTDFPVHEAVQQEFGGGTADAFISGFDPFGCPPLYSTYLGGEGDDFGSAVAVDISGHVYVTGETRSANFNTDNAKQQHLAGGSDAFVTKLELDGSAFVYSTYLGGAGFDGGRGIAVDSSGHAYVTGRTDSHDFPTTNNVVQPVAAGEGDAFVSKFNPSGSALVYSTYLGGSKSDEGRGIAVDLDRQAYVIGKTASLDFLEVNPLQNGFEGEEDAFLAKLGARGSTLEYSTYLGGSREDIGNGIDWDVSGNAYVTGVMRSVDFQTVGTFRNLLGRASSGAAFIAKIDRGDVSELDLPDLVIHLDRVKFVTRPGGDRVVVSVTVQNIGMKDVRDPFLIALLLSDNNRADEKDLLVQSASVNGIKAGRKMRHKMKFTDLNSLDGKFIIVRADSENVVIESHERNNTKTRALVNR